MHFITFSFDLVGPSTKDLQSPLDIEDVPSNSTVQQLKLIIQDTAGITVARQSIHYSGELLEDHLTIGHYITADEAATVVAATIEVAPEHHKVAVMAIPLTGDGGGGAGPTVVRIRQDSSVKELKEKICRKMGFYDVAMTCNGVKVEGDCFGICEFGIKEGSEVYVRQSLNVGPR